MALECICIATQSRGQAEGQFGGQKRTSPKYCEDGKKAKSLKDIDLCDIEKRSQDEEKKHNDYECHIKGEKRQNLINKIKMYLDDYDDRPVMKRKGKGEDEGKALGQTGFGPLIKYPGYVDYDHPYFSEPYNKMPNLAMTVGQRGQNPCVPLQVRNWDECYGKGGQGQKASAAAAAAAASQSDQMTGSQNDGKCHCAERRGEFPRCPAAGKTPLTPDRKPQSASAGYGAATSNPCQAQGGFIMPPRQMAMTPPPTPANGSMKYICIPLPDDC